MKSRKNLIMVISATLFFIVFVLLLNDIMIYIRLNELTARLQEIDQNEGSIDHINLVTTYEIHKKLFESRITQDKADEIEHKLNTLSRVKAEKAIQFSSLYSILAMPALKIINLNRVILGKMPVTFHRTHDSFSMNLDLAYYYERNFHFKRAIELYDKSLTEKNLTDSLRASILLHQGYCFALSQLNDKARKNYLTIIEKYARESSAITATVLLRYLEGFHLARQKILSAKGDPLQQSQKLVNLLAYKQALSILEAVERTAGAEDQLRINYYKARCLAGLGDTARAVESYLHVITSAPTSDYARYSGRKLFIIGERSGEANLVDISIKLNNTIKDSVLSHMINEKDSSISNGIAQKDMINVEFPSDAKKKIEGIISAENKNEVKSLPYLTIYTSDGNTFKGIKIDETEDYITLKTSIGSINVKKDRIKKIIYQ